MELKFLRVLIQWEGLAPEDTSCEDTTTLQQEYPDNIMNAGEEYKDQQRKINRAKKRPDKLRDFVDH